MRVSTSIPRWLIPAILAWLLVSTLYTHNPSHFTLDNINLHWLISKNQAPLPSYIDRAQPRLSAPYWCATLIRHPRERERSPGIFDCGRDRYGALCSDGRPRFFAQYNQDMYLYMNHFRHLTRRGVYLEIATNEPVRISNTCFFDACLGWAGVCVEANPKYYQPIRDTRSCALVRACLGDKVYNATFLLRDGLGGVEETNKNAHVWRANGQMDERKKVTLRCVRASDALTPLGIAHIDLLSLDVEGHEYHVLKGINWNITHINVIIMESSTLRTSELLRDNGFKLLKIPNRGKGPGQLLSDTIFIHKSVKWGKPK